MKKVFIAIGLLILSLPLYSQETGGEAAGSDSLEKVQRKLFIYPCEVVSVSGSEKGELLIRQALAFDEYLKIAVAENTDVVLVEKEEESDCRIRSVLAGTEGGGVNITLFAFDALKNVEAFKLEKTLSPFSMVDLQDTFLSLLTEKIDENFPRREPEVVEVTKEKIVEQVEVKEVFVQGKSTLTVKGPVGTEIESQTGKLYIIGKSGEIEIKAPVNSNMNLHVEKKGYFPVDLQVAFGEEDKEIMLDLEKAGSVVLSMRLRIPDLGLSPGVELFVIPNTLFLSFYLEENLISVSSLIRAIGGLQVIPSFYPVLSAGMFYFSPNNAVRVALSMGVFTRVVVPFDAPAYISKTMTFGFRPSFLLEASPFKRARFFLEFSPRFAYNRAPNLNDKSGGNIKITDNFYLYPAGFLGVRVIR